MSTVAIIAAGLGLLLVAGIYQLSTARLAGPDAKRSQLLSADSTTFTPADLRNPSNVIRDGEKLRNAVVVLLEVAAIVMAVWMTIYVYSLPTIDVAFKLLILAALVVGALLVGRGLYLRLGLYEPVTIQESLRETAGADVARDFASIGGALETARGGDPIDEATVGLLAAAKNAESIETLKRWARSEDVADPETFDEHADALAAAGVIENEGGELTVHPQFEDADDDQLATVTASVLD